MDTIKTFQTMLTRLASEMLLPLVIAGKDGKISKEEFNSLAKHAVTVLGSLLNDYAQKQFNERPIDSIKLSLK